MCCSPHRGAVRAATHYHTRAWQMLIYGKQCYILIVIYLPVPNYFIQLYAKNVHRNIMKHTTNSHQIGGNQKRQYYRQTLTKNSKKTEFYIAIFRPTGDNWQSKTLGVAISDLLSSIVRQEFSNAAYLVWKHMFQVALVSDCFGYVFRLIFNKHFTMGAIKNDNTINE